MAFMAFYGVHQPLEAKKEDVLRNKKEIDSYDFGEQPEFVPEGTGRTKMRQNHPVYAGMVENLDMNVGKVLSFLEEKGLDKNTIVVFSSDHGGLSNDGTKQRDLATSNFPLRAGKGWMYEGGIKVPLFIRYPGQIKARTEKRSIVMLMDLMPTLLDLAGGERIEGIPAKSMRPVLETKEVWDDRTVFWYASSARPVNTGESKSIVVRSGKWKLLHFYEEDRVELYNIAKDPYEQNDLSGKKKCKTKKLMKKIESWKESW
jgi:arylsulfatase A-like enzyme